MHEVAIAEGLLDLVCEEAARAAATRVRAIRLAVGPLAGVEPAALTQAFDVASRGSIAEGARIVLDAPAGRANCMGCGADFEVLSRDQPCPTCARHRWLLTRGDELRLVELEVD
jgi:hydrogenase nickel incorporation protein HypA/HybF